MPQRNDNRVRITPVVWDGFCKTCSDLNMNPAYVINNLAMWFAANKQMPGVHHGNTYYAPQPIPDIKPQTSDSFVNTLLDGDLFT